MLERSSAVLILGLFAACSAVPADRSVSSKGPPIVCIRTVDGADLEGLLQDELLVVDVGSDARLLSPQQICSVHRGAAASAHESEVIAQGLQTLTSGDARAAEQANEALVDIGLPVLSPLLDAYQDTDAHEPDTRYRLFGRIVPAGADARDRALDLVRLRDGSRLRGRMRPQDLHLRTANGTVATVPFASIRRVAVRLPEATRDFELDSLHDCTYVSFVDTGLVVTGTTAMHADASGFVRLSFAEDGWATGPDGLFETLPGKRKMQEGFRWGAVLGRVGAAGDRWLIGSHLERDGFGGGRLYCVINDNEHWQNNIGGYRLKLRVTDVYDVGDPR